VRGLRQQYHTVAAAFLSADRPELQLKFFIVYHLTSQDRAIAVATLTRILGRGSLQHNIAARTPLNEIVAAHERVEQGSWRETWCSGSRELAISSDG
jgi:hypothetical protein